MKNANETNWSGIESIIDRKLGLKSDISPELFDLFTNVEKLEYLIDVRKVLVTNNIATRKGYLEINSKRTEGDFVAGTDELW